MWFRKIRMRKTQFLIIALLTMMATAILMACVSFTLETQKFVEKYYGAEEAPIAFAVSAREDATDLLLEDEKASAIISTIKEGKAKYITEPFRVDGNAVVNEGNFFYSVVDSNDIGYSLIVAQGEEKKAPADDEIWVSNIFADTKGVELGDRFRIGADKEYEVSAIVNTALCSSGFIDNFPFYVSERTLQELSGKEGYAQFIYCADEELSLREFQDALPAEYVQNQMFMLDRTTLKMCLSILTGIFGGVGTVAAIIILAVSIVVFRYLVRATIEKEYQLIGTYKALGRDNKEIKGIYFLAYMVSGITGMIPGFFFARPLAIYLGRAVLGGNKAFVLTGCTSVVGILTILFISLVLTLNINSELKKVHSISPIQAMNLQTLSSMEKLNKSIIPSASSSLAMAVNGLWKRKGTSFLVILILTVSVYMDVMAGEVALTLSHYAQDRNVWENLPAYDCVIKTMGNEEVLEYVAKSENIRDYVQVMLEPECNGMVIEGTDWTAEEAHPMIYSDFNETRYEGVPFTRGRICLEPHEITASQQFLDEVGKKVGDYIKISNDDKEVKFLIVGSYSAMMKGGASFYMHEDDYKELGFDVDFQTILVFLKDTVDYEEFARVFEEKVEQGYVFEDFGFVEQEGDTVGDIANPICAVLFAAFAAFSILNIVNLVHTQIKENRRKYGILKAMGFTTGYICRENLASLTIQYGIAILLTILLNETLSPILFSLACGIRFICKPAWLTTAVCGAMYVVLMMITLMMLQTIRKIKPVELMEE